MWLDASDTSTITLATTAVSGWNDKSGYARHLTQATSGNRPTYSTSAMAAATTTAPALPGVTFAGGSSATTVSFLKGTAAFATAFTSSSYFIVSNAVKPTKTSYIFCEGASGTTTGYYCPVVNSTTPSISPKMATDTGTASTLPTISSAIVGTTTASINLGMVQDTKTALSGYANGVLGTASAPSYARPSPLTVNIPVLGTRFRANAAAPSATNIGFLGSIGEFIITNGILSATDRQKLEGYSAHKWLSNTKLQTTHTYYASPP
jgi:hypothetical protein